MEWQALLKTHQDEHSVLVDAAAQGTSISYTAGDLEQFMAEEYRAFLSNSGAELDVDKYVSDSGIELKLECHNMEMILHKACVQAKQMEAGCQVLYANMLRAWQDRQTPVDSIEVLELLSRAS